MASELKTRVKMSKNGNQVELVLQSEDATKFRVVVGDKVSKLYKNTGPALTKFYEQVGKLAVDGWQVVEQE